ncbi:hypothetical protein CA14_001677 [Aspergillus flavus]|uniref:Oxidase ustYa n=1 Tax=Aspergillus flavus TaxID=5059 RepID=A0AB74C329_ASPFL|nr:hypothetical protein CA14_001677 [Aspergillus flavus]
MPYAYIADIPPLSAIVYVVTARQGLGMSNQFLNPKARFSSMGTVMSPVAQRKYLPMYPEHAHDMPDKKSVSLSEVKARLWLPIVVIVLLVVFMIASLTAVTSDAVNLPTTRHKAKSPTPEFQIVNTPFLESPRFENLRTKRQITEAWGRYGLPSYGFVTVPDPEAYDLKPNKDVVPGTNNTYMVSVYHQLHCLKIMHLALLPIISRQEGRGPGTRDDHDFEHNHLEHCLDYLRQSVMCSGDVTLEPPDEMPQKNRSPLQGWGVTHACRSWEQIEGWRGDWGVI